MYDKNALGLAFNNAGLLYNIQGGDLTTSVYGEGHIARSVTPNGNGIPPQALMDTLGQHPGGMRGLRQYGDDCKRVCDLQCVIRECNEHGQGMHRRYRWSAADVYRNDGRADGYRGCGVSTLLTTPAGDPSNANFVSNLFGLSTGTVPFTPNLSSNPAPNGQPTGQPNDFTATIAFAVPSSAGGTDDLLNQPQVISIDGGAYLGDEYPATTYTEANGYYQEGIWIGNYGSQAVKLFADGGVPGLRGEPEDWQHNEQFQGRRDRHQHATRERVDREPGDRRSAGIFHHRYPRGTIYPTTTNPTGPNDQFNLPSFTTLDNNGDVFIPQIGANNLLEIGPDSLGAPLTCRTSATSGLSARLRKREAFSTAAPCLSQASNAVFDQNGVLYTYGAGSGDVCTLTIPQGTVNSTKTGFSVTNTSFEGPASFAIDKNNALWGDELQHEVSDLL